MAFPSLSVRALPVPETKSKTTSQYKHYGILSSNPTNGLKQNLLFRKNWLPASCAEKSQLGGVTTLKLLFPHLTPWQDLSLIKLALHSEPQSAKVIVLVVFEASFQSLTLRGKTSHLKEEPLSKVENQSLLRILGSSEQMLQHSIGIQPGVRSRATWWGLSPMCSTHCVRQVFDVVEYYSSWSPIFKFAQGF